jgi:hypothetical protein
MSGSIEPALPLLVALGEKPHHGGTENTEKYTENDICRAHLSRHDLARLAPASTHEKDSYGSVTPTKPFSVRLSSVFSVPPW